MNPGYEQKSSFLESRSRRNILVRSRDSRSRRKILVCSRDSRSRRKILVRSRESRSRRKILVRSRDSRSRRKISVCSQDSLAQKKMSIEERNIRKHLKFQTYSGKIGIVRTYIIHYVLCAEPPFGASRGPQCNLEQLVTCSERTLDFFSFKYLTHSSCIFGLHKGSTKTLLRDTVYDSASLSVHSTPEQC